MTVWMLHLPMTAQEESGVAARKTLPLPFDGLPDLSTITSPQECKKLLQALHPEEPPETVNRKLIHVWKQLSDLHPEDIIAVPLPHQEEVALAEVTGPYQYEVGQGGSDVHTVSVKWHEKRVPFRALAKHKEILKPGTSTPLKEIEAGAARTIIRDRLPHKYNRFAALKWILAIFFLLHAVALLARLLK